MWSLNSVSNFEVKAHVGTKIVSLVASTGAEFQWTPEVAMQIARQIMHAAYTLGYEPPVEGK